MNDIIINIAIYKIKQYQHKINHKWFKKHDPGFTRMRTWPAKTLKASQVIKIRVHCIILLYYFTPILPYRWFYLLSIAGLQVISYRFNFMMIQLTEPVRNCFIIVIINMILFLITFIPWATFIRWFVCISPERPFRCCHFMSGLLWNIRCKCCGSFFFILGILCLLL